ncbi:MAG: hemopexin repeat-containing protein [Byssovorax sp.]
MPSNDWSAGLPEGETPAAWNSHPSGPLLSGPMVGETSGSTARIWAQGRDESPLTLSVHRQNGTTFRQTLQPSLGAWNCVTFTVDGLHPGEACQFSLESAHGKTDGFPLRGAPADSARKLVIAFGSCFWNYPDQKLTIFDAIRRERPDVFLMIGDNCYYGGDDWGSEHGMMMAQLRHRNNDPLRRLLAEVPVLAIWDDHDFGPNDSDSSFAGASLPVFQRVFAQSTYGLPETPGIFSTVRMGPVEFFLLDNRSYRVEHSHMLGEAQMTWLLDRLEKSRAPIKVFVSGSQVFPEAAPGLDWECWKRDAPGELEQILSFIEERDIRGVVYISGDVHLGYLLHAPSRTLPDGRRGPSLWELTSSPLANDPWTETVLGRNLYDRTVITEHEACNYGVLDIDLDRPGEEIRMRLAGERGETLVAQPVSLGALRVRSAPEGITAALHTGNAVYFFRGDRYLRLDPETREVLPGYPKDIASHWPGLGSEHIHAAVRWDARKAFFFQGNGYTAYDLGADRALPGYPRYVSRFWPGVWPTGVDAAVVWNNGKAYLFKGSVYVRYDMAADRVDAGFPQLISAHWPGIWPGGIDAVIVWGDGKAYFFKGREVIRYDMAKDQADPGYPRPIEEEFPGVLGTLDVA